MKKIGTLNKGLSNCIAGIGHTDMLVVCDAGLPIPEETNRIDLAYRFGMPPFLDVLDTILEELAVEKIIIAEETKGISPKRFAEIVERFPNIEIETMSHIEFKKTATAAKGFVRTGECTPYSNIILVAGVTY